MSTSKRTTKTTIALIGLTGILALYASSLALTALMPAVPEAFAGSSSDSSNDNSVSGDNHKIDKSEEQQYLEGAKQCFDRSNDYLQLENCLSDTINEIIEHNSQDEQKQ